MEQQQSSTYDPRFRRTKIVATIGPASADPATLARMIDAGVDVVRVNSSHGTADERIRFMGTIRQVATQRKRHVAILVDLQGPRIRVGTLRAPRPLETGSQVVFAPEGEAADHEIPTTYEGLATDVRPGSRILLDDGVLAVDVAEARGSKVYGRVLHGGLLKGHKGINLPDDPVSAPAVTLKDREDIALAVEHGADYIGVSFVSRGADLEEVRGLVPDQVRLVAKIERASALSQLFEIVGASDAVMVARGDLGVELPYEEVPLVQKQLIRQATRQGRAVITATQMLESMISHPRPTRAEASDVANAIFDGTDAVMLSAETAVGEYPVETVQAMARIIRETERAVIEDAEGWMRRRRTDALHGDEHSVDDAIALATTAAAEMLHVPVIVSFTKSGFTPQKVALHRPSVPIIAVSTDEATCRRLALVWGVVPECTNEVPNYEAMLDSARDTLLEKAYVNRGDLIVVTAGVPFDVPGTTNLLKVEVV